MDNDWLTLAIQAFNKNDLIRARELLWGYVNYYRKDAQGWLWYSRVQERRADKIACLQHARALSPNDSTILAEWELVAGRTSFFAKPPVPAPAGARPHPPAARPPARPITPVRHPRLTAHAPRLSPASPFKVMWLTAQSFLLVGALTLFLVALLSVLPMFFGNRTLIILSGSMEPAIPTGGLVIAQPVPSRNLDIGDVIVYSPGAESQIPIVHRIADISERRGTRYYATRGDANPSADVAEVALPATAWRVGASWPLVGYVISFAASPLGIFILIVLPLIGLVVLTALDWLRQNQAPLVAALGSTRPSLSRSR